MCVCETGQATAGTSGPTGYPTKLLIPSGTPYLWTLCRDPWPRKSDNAGYPAKRIFGQCECPTMPDITYCKMCVKPDRPPAHPAQPDIRQNYLIHPALLTFARCAGSPGPGRWTWRRRSPPGSSSWSTFPSTKSVKMSSSFTKRLNEMSSSFTQRLHELMVRFTLSLRERSLNNEDFVQRHSIL